MCDVIALFTGYFIFHTSGILLNSDFSVLPQLWHVSCRIRSSSFIIWSLHTGKWGFQSTSVAMSQLKVYCLSLIHWHSLSKGRSTSYSPLFACYQTLIWLWAIVNVLPELHLQFVVWLIPEALHMLRVNLYLPGKVAPSESSRSTMKVKNIQQ